MPVFVNIVSVFCKTHGDELSHLTNATYSENNNHACKPHISKVNFALKESSYYSY